MQFRWYFAFFVCGCVCTREYLKFLSCLQVTQVSKVRIFWLYDIWNIINKRQRIFKKMKLIKKNSKGVSLEFEWNSNKDFTEFKQLLICALFFKIVCFKIFTFEINQNIKDFYVLYCCKKFFQFYFLTLLTFF